MDTRRITDRYSVAPQIMAEDLAAIAAAGFTTVICNRPDTEVPDELRAARIGDAAAAAGLAFHDLPLTHDSMTPGRIAHQRRIGAEATGPILAYCASGTRCTVIWALGEAGHRDTDEILSMARAAGYDLAALRPQLEALAARGGA